MTLQEQLIDDRARKVAPARNLLKCDLSRHLPEMLTVFNWKLCWKPCVHSGCHRKVKESEMLTVCNEIEKALTVDQHVRFLDLLKASDVGREASAPWLHRGAALAVVLSSVEVA